MKIVTIKQALQHVADNPVLKTDVLLDVHTHELVARSLFEIANGVQVSERGSLSRANVARTMIFNRLVGRRKPGSHPATHQKVELDFVDLTGGELEA
jgi:hypothetical protein